MGFIHHQPAVVSALHLNEACQIRSVTIHAVVAFDDHQNAFEAIAMVAQKALQGIDIVVRETHARSAR